MIRDGNRLAGGLVIVGAVTMAVGAFLPLNQPAGHIARGAMPIQYQNWMLVAVAAAIATGGYWASRRQSYEWLLPLTLCVVALAGGLDGFFDTSWPTGTALGTAVYVAGGGIAVALLGSLLLSRGRVGRAVVKCGNCKHKQKVPAHQVKYVCKQCNKHMKRRL